MRWLLMMRRKIWMMMMGMRNEIQWTLHPASTTATLLCIIMTYTTSNPLPSRHVASTRFRTHSHRPIPNFDASFIGALAPLSNPLAILYPEETEYQHLC